MTSIRAVFTPVPEKGTFDKTIKARREEMSAKTLHQTEAKESLAKDTVEIAKPKKKSFWKGLSSFLLTGSGQMFDGRFKDGLKDLGIQTGLLVGSGVIAKLGAINLAKVVEATVKNPAVKATPYGWYASIAACGLLGIAVLANKIHSVVDAYKGGK